MIIKKKGELNPDVIDNDEMEGVRFYPLITSGDGAPNFAMRLFEVSPGGHTTKHKHSWEHEVYMVSGGGYVLQGEKRIKIEKDDCIFIEPYELHQFQAGKDGISMICVVPNKGHHE